MQDAVKGPDVGSQVPAVELEGLLIETVDTIESREHSRIHCSFSQGTFLGARVITPKMQLDIIWAKCLTQTSAK